jgi:NADPH:quinone reductase-like Zn-dependent oxidoreductase
MLGRGSSNVKVGHSYGNRENLHALAALLASDDVKVIEKVYPLSDGADAVAHMLGHHARGKVVVGAQRR